MATINITNTQGVEMSTNPSLPRSWDLTHDSTLGGSLGTSNLTSTSFTVGAGYSGYGGGTFYINRVYLDFDLSGIPAGSTITAATLKLRGSTFSSSHISDTIATADIILLEGTFDSSIDTGDIDAFSGFQAGWDGTDSGIIEYSAEYEAGSWSTSAYNEITITSDGITALNNNFTGGNRFKVVVMEHDHDYHDNVNGENGNSIDVNNDRFGVNFKINPSDSDPPTLVVTYSTVSSEPQVILSNDLIIHGGNVEII